MVRFWLLGVQTSVTPGHRHALAQLNVIPEGRKWLAELRGHACSERACRRGAQEF